MAAVPFTQHRNASKLRWLLFSFQGRINRSTWWTTIITLWAVSLVLGFSLGFGAGTIASSLASDERTQLEKVWAEYCPGSPFEERPTCNATPRGVVAINAAGDAYDQRWDSTYYLLWLPTLIVLAALFAWSWFALGAKRLHDTGHSGMWQLLVFIPYVGGLILLGWLGLVSTKESATPTSASPAAPDQTE